MAKRCCIRKRSVIRGERAGEATGSRATSASAANFGALVSLRDSREAPCSWDVLSCNFLGLS